MRSVLSPTPTATDPRRGAGMVEIIVAVVLMSVAILGMIQMGLVARMQAGQGEIQTRMWSVASATFEEIRMEPYDSMFSGSDTVQGYPVEWTVTGSEPKTIRVMITRPAASGGTAVDTFVTLKSDWGNE